LERCLVNKRANDVIENGKGKHVEEEEIFGRGRWDIVSRPEKEGRCDSR